MMDPILPIDGASRPPSSVELERLADDQLMASLKAGCHEALAVLFDRYHRLVLSIALKIVRDPGEAEDVMQSVFLDVFRAVAQFDAARGTTKVWLMQCAYHCAISRSQYLNRRGFYNREDTEDVTKIPPEDDFLPGKFTPAELGILVKKGLGTLNSVQRRVIELAIYDGLSMKEIAEKTGESLLNVRHYYYRGLKKLRAFVEGPREMRKAVADG
jgi:RNA polymerase sigma-70 factor (ECF subfamily)